MRIILWRDRLLRFGRHPLVLILFSGLVVWRLQQEYLKNQDKSKMKMEVMETILPIYTQYYQEIWNEWHAFQNKMPSEEYRRNIQTVTIKAKAIETKIPILFRDRQIYKDWKEILHNFWAGEYPISRDGISEQQLNEKLNLNDRLIDDILNRMYKEIK